MGIGEDNSLTEEIAVTVIATGFDMKQQDEILHIEPKKTIYSLEDENEISENVEKKQKPLHQSAKNREERKSYIQKGGGSTETRRRWRRSWIIKTRPRWRRSRPT